MADSHPKHPPARHANPPDPAATESLAGRKPTDGAPSVGPESAEFLLRALGSTNSAVWIEDLQSRPVRIWVQDQAYQRVLGRDPDVLRRSPADWLQAIEPMDRLGLVDLLEQDGGFEVVANLAGGRGRVEVARPAWWPKGTRRFRLLTVRPVREAPSQLHGDQPVPLHVEHLELLLRGSGRGVALLDRHLAILKCNLAFAARLGATPEGLQGIRWFDLVHPDDRRGLTLGLRDLDRKEPGLPTGRRLEHRLLRGQQAPVWVRTDLTKVGLPGTQEHAFLAVSVDITGQRRADELFDRRVRRQEAIAELARIALTLHDVDTVADHAVTLLNEALDTEAASLFQVEGDRPRHLVLRASQGWAFHTPDQEQLRLTPDNPLSWQLTNPSGQVIEPMLPDGYHAPSDAMAPLSRPDSLCIVVGDRGKPFGVLAVHGAGNRRFRRADSAVLQAFGSILAAAVDRERQTADLRRSEDRLEMSLHSAGLGMWEWHPYRDEVLMDERACQLLEMPHAVDGTSSDEWLARFHPADRPRLEAMMQAGILEEGARTTEEVRVRYDEGWRWVLVAGRTQNTESDRREGRILGVLMDVGARKTLEQQLQQAQKMEGLGRLAGGVAHDFNNLLTAVLGHAEIARLQLPADHPLQQDIGAILDAGNRAAALTSQLLAFARRQDSDPRFLCLKSLLEDVRPLLRSLLEDNVVLSMDLPDAIAPVRVDPVQMEQVLVNLAVNAADAMEDGGNLEIRLEQLPPRNGPEIGPVRHKGPMARITVTDTGSGIPPEIQEKIFEPFFTTKEQSRGTGLGLATCYGIVSQAGGEMTLDSTPGEGTTFHVLLPAFADAEPTPLGLGKGLPAVREITPRTATILLVEDDGAVRRLGAGILRARGHEVLPACDGGEAMALAAACADGVDLLISDVIMPGMSGPDLAQKLWAAHGDLPVLFLSGHVGEHLMPEEDPDAKVWFLRKPFTGTGLARKVAAILRREMPGGAESPAGESAEEGGDAPQE